MGKGFIGGIIVGLIVSAGFLIIMSSVLPLQSGPQETQPAAQVTPEQVTPIAEPEALPTPVPEAPQADPRPAGGVQSEVEVPTGSGFGQTSDSEAEVEEVVEEAPSEPPAEPEETAEESYDTPLANTESAAIPEVNDTVDTGGETASPKLDNAPDNTLSSEPALPSPAVPAPVAPPAPVPPLSPPVPLQDGAALDSGAGVQGLEFIPLPTLGGPAAPQTEAETAEEGVAADAESEAETTEGAQEDAGSEESAAVTTINGVEFIPLPTLSDPAAVPAEPTEGETTSEEAVEATPEGAEQVATEAEPKQEAAPVVQVIEQSNEGGVLVRRFTPAAPEPADDVQEGAEQEGTDQAEGAADAATTENPEPAAEQTEAADTAPAQ